MIGQLVSRQVTPSAAPVAMQAQTDALMVRAKQIASAPKNMLPAHYQNNPGACLMAVDWAERHGVSIFEALGEVAFVHGRPVVSAVLQKKLAARHGFRTQVLESSESQATVAVIDPNGERVGETTYTLDMAKALGIFKGQVWNADPAHMLVKRATTRALEYFGPSELAVIMADPDSDGARVEAEVEAAPQEPHLPLPVVQPETAPETPTGETDAPVDAVEVERPSEDELRALIKKHKVTMTATLKTAQQMYPDAGLTTMEALAAHPQAAFDLEDWIKQQ